MNVVLKIHALAAAPASLIDPVTGIEFLVVGQTESHVQLFGECPRCKTGVIEHDLPISDMSAPWAPALCERCEDEPVEAGPAPRAHSPIPAPRPRSSLTISTGRTAMPKLKIVQPVFAPTPTPVCTKCGRFMAPNLDGNVRKVCGTCKAEGRPAAERPGCRDCGADMTGYHEHREYCPSCQRGRVAMGWKRKNASRARAIAEKAAKNCQTCQTPLGEVHKLTRFCPSCRMARDKEHERERDLRKRMRAREKESETEMEKTNG